MQKIVIIEYYTIKIFVAENFGKFKLVHQKIYSLIQYDKTITKLLICQTLNFATKSYSANILYYTIFRGSV